MALEGRVVLLGGAGQLGSEIRRAWSGVDIVAPARGALDITDAASAAAFISGARPAVVVNCAAFHNVEQCEREPDKAFAANAVAVDALARASAAVGARFVTISTDYVFDGSAGRPYTEADPPAPLNAYGVSKYAGELLVQRLGSDAVIVRTCGVYGLRPSSAKGYTFVDRIIRQKRAGEAVRVVSDQFVTPTFAGDLAKGLLQLLRSEAPPGIYHMANEGAVSWYDYAREALRGAGVDDSIEAISYNDWKTDVRRPPFSALENARMHQLGLSMPDWRAGLRSYLDALATQ